jgi:VCBS repeat-containing protein
VASDQTPAPQLHGNVLPNDIDVDHGDALTVTAVRTGAETATGTQGTPGATLAGLYGSLVLNTDGSYTYAIDMSNPAVLAVAGMGKVLQDVFTYTMTDIAGATDTAQLVIHLNISAPYIPVQDGAGPNGHSGISHIDADVFLPAIDPGLFVTPEVADVAAEQSIFAHGIYREQDYLTSRDVRLGSLGRGLGQVEGQYVARSVIESRLRSELDLSRILQREGRTSLSADGLLPNPSIYANSLDEMIRGFMPAADTADAPALKTAQVFSAQLAEAARKLQPVKLRIIE